MQNSESVKIPATTTVAADATTIIAPPTSPIQESEGSHHEPLVSLSPGLEIKSTGDDDAEVDQNPTLVGVGHKRKASTDIDPFSESDPKTSLGSKRITSPPVSTPTAEQHQVDEEMLTQGGDSEKVVEGDQGVSADEGLGKKESDLIDKVEGTVKTASNIDEEKKVETNAMNIESEGDKGVSDGGLVEKESEESKEETGLLNSKCNVEEEDAGTESMDVEEAETESEENEGEDSVNSPNEAENEKVEFDAIESVRVDGDEGGEKGTVHVRKVTEIDLNSPMPCNVEKGTKVESGEGVKEAEGNTDMAVPRAVRLLGIDLNVAAEGVVQSPRVDLNRDNSLLDLNVNPNAVKIQETHSAGGGCIVFEYPYFPWNVVGAKNPTGIDLMAPPPPFQRRTQETYPFSHHKSELGESSGGAADKVEGTKFSKEELEDTDSDDEMIQPPAEGGGQRRQVVLALPAYPNFGQKEPETEPKSEPEPEPEPEHSPPAQDEARARASSNERSPPAGKFRIDLNKPPGDWA